LNLYRLHNKNKAATGNRNSPQTVPPTNPQATPPTALPTTLPAATSPFAQSPTTAVVPAALLVALLSALLFLSGCNGDQHYSGNEADGLPHGNGTLVCPYGTTYIGTFDHGLRNGNGQWLHPSGIIYTGGWKNDIYHSWGTLEIPNGTNYQGFWQEGLKNGIGSQTWPDGRRYEGNWKNGRMHGFGEIHYPEGSTYRGDWVEGRMHGQGVHTTPDGEMLTGTWENGQFIYIPVAAIALDREALTLTVGQETATLELIILPIDATNQKVTWSSSEPEIAAIDDQGQVAPLKPGTATITALAVAEELSAECQVTVILPWVPVESVRIDPPYFNFYPTDEPYTLRAIITPAGATDKTVSWSSSNPETVSVDPFSGRMVPRQIGMATITVKTEDGDYTATCYVQVRQASPFSIDFPGNSESAQDD
jgi:uncharacterized protein YjdB